MLCPCHLSNGPVPRAPSCLPRVRKTPSLVRRASVYACAVRPSSVWALSNRPCQFKAIPGLEVQVIFAGIAMPSHPENLATRTAASNFNWAGDTLNNRHLIAVLCSPVLQSSIY